MPGLSPIVSLAAAVIGCVVLAAVGARARRVARLPIGPAARPGVDFVIGAWVFAMAGLACGLARLLIGGVLLVVAVALAATGRWRARGWRGGAAAAVALPALIFLPAALAPPFFYDALVYHLALPWQALLEERLSPHPENLFATFPPLAQLVALFPLAAGLDRVPALLHLASFVVAGTALAALGTRAGAPRWAAILAGMALPLSPLAAPLPGYPAAEGWFLAAVLGALAVAAGGRDTRGGAVLAGLLAGIGAAARLQGLPWTVLVFGLLAYRSRRPLARLAAAAAGWLAGSAPWWLKNLVLLRDPAAPLFWRRQGIDTLWRDAGSLAFSPSARGPFGAALRHAVLSLEFAYLLPLILAAALACWTLRGARIGRWGAMAVFGLLAWGMSGTLPRFLLPSLAVLLLLAAAGARTRAGSIAGGLALSFALVLGAAASGVYVQALGGLRLLGRDAGSLASAATVNDPLPAFREARALPEDARVLFVGEARAFPFPRRFVSPSQHDVSLLRDPIERLGSAREVIDWLRGRGFTHILVSRAEMVRLTDQYPVVPWRSDAGRARFQGLLDLCGTPLIKKDDVAIFSLRESSPQ